MKKVFLAVATTLLLCSCANTELATKQNINDAAIQEASQTNITTKEAVNDAQRVLEEAQNQDLSFYTPLHYKSALDSLEKIHSFQKDQMISNSSETDLIIITEAFKIQKMIGEAFKVKSTIETVLSSALKHKVVLDEIGSMQEFPKDYNQINADLIELFKLIENKKVEKALKNQVSLLNDMTKIEVDTLISLYIKPAKLILDNAEGLDADDYAEQTFKEAEFAIKSGKLFITVNPRNLSEIKLIGNKAVIAAKRALNISTFSKGLVDLDEKSAEIKALEVESLLATVIVGFAANDLQGLTLQEQSQKLALLAIELEAKKNAN